MPAPLLSGNTGNNLIIRLAQQIASYNIPKMQGFNEQQILEIRKAAITFDHKLDALSKLAKGITENRGHADPQLVENFYEVGYDEGSLVDVVMVVGDKIIANYMYALTAMPIDWPIVPEL